MAGKGLQDIPLRVPKEWDSAWFTRFVREVLAQADVRNAVEGTGISITGNSSEPATLSASSAIAGLLNVPFVTVSLSSQLTAERVLTAGDGIEFVDGGPDSTLTINVTDIPYSSLGDLPPLSVLGNQLPTDAQPGAINGIQAGDVLWIRDVDGAGTLNIEFSNTPVWTGLHTFEVTPDVPDESWTYAKIQDVSTDSVLLGRGDSGAPGPMEEITLGSGLAMTGTVLSAPGGFFDAIDDASAVRVLESSDSGAYIRMTSADFNSVVVPPDELTDFADNTDIIVRQAGAGTTEIVAGAGVTLNGPYTVLGGQYSTFQLKNISLNTWDIIRIEDDSALYRIALTVPSSSVTAALTSFPVYVDLADLPADFWTHVAYRDGRDLRVKTSSGTDIPFDLVRFDPEAQEGALFLRQSVTNAGDTTVYLHYGDRSLSAVAVGATNGRNAVWSDYHRVFLFGDSYADRTGNGADATVAGTPSTFGNVSTSANLGVHQGVCFDGEHYYVTDTNAIKKYDTSFTLVTTNTNPCGDVGGGVDHVGDPDVYGGILYVPIETYVNPTTFSNQKITRFRASDLTFIDAVDVSAQAHECSSVCYVPSEDRLYVSSFGDGSKLWRYNASTLAYISALSLSTTIAEIQGVTFWRGAFWVNSDSTDATIRVETSGTVRGRVWGITGGAYEGIGHSDDALLVLHDTTGSSDGVVRRIEPLTTAGGGGSSFPAGNSYLLATGVTRYTTWTMGATVKLASKGSNRAVVSYEVNGSVVTTDRATFAFRNSSDRFGLWNATDSWLEGTNAPSTGTTYRLNVTHTGTTDRKLYTNGGDQKVDSGVATKPGASANALYIGIENAVLAEDMDGEIGFVYLRAAELTAAWIAAEYSNLSAPSSFYSIGSEELQ